LETSSYLKVWLDRLGPLWLAGIVTLLNAAKPPCVDDPAYLALARHIAQQPLDPYGFEQFWYDRPQPANEVLAPPVLPYYLALGIRLGGDDPVWLKLWLFPWIAGLVFSLRSLVRRVAPRLAGPVVIAIILSPWILPAVNFMLDVPTLALVTTAVRLYRDWPKHRELWSALLAGLVGGVAAQTKYTGLLVLAVFVLADFPRQRFRRPIVAGSVAVFLFVGWEFWIAQKYGQSHFLLALRNNLVDWTERLHFLIYALRLLGGLGFPIILVALSGLTARRSVLVLTALGWIATLLVMVVARDGRHSVWLPAENQVGSGVQRVVWTAWGIVVVGCCAQAIVRIGRRERHRFVSSWSGFLALWCLVELLGACWMSPFPAGRRIMGLATVTTMLVARSCRRQPSARQGSLVAVLSAMAGLFFALTDRADADLEPQAIEAAIRWVRSQPSGSDIWFVGHWGTQEAALTNGCRPLIPGQSSIRAGDWLLQAPAWVSQPQVRLDEGTWELQTTVVIERCWPFRTLPPFYGGDQVIEVWPAPMIEMRVYRCRRDGVPLP